MNQSEAFWDRQAPSYDKAERDSYRELIEHTIPHLQAGDHVLDFACGTGAITLELAEHVQAIHGIDLSSGMIDIATKKAVQRGASHVTFQQATLFDAHLDGQLFDVIVAYNILHLLDNIPQALQRINQLLKSGGMFISVTACMGEKRTFLGVLLPILGKFRLVPEITALSVAGLETLIADAHFDIISTDLLSESPPSTFVVARKR